MIEQSILAATLVIVRTSSVMFFFPVFGDGRLPKTVKIGLAVALGGMFFLDGPSQSNLSPEMITSDVGWLRILLIVLAEILFGACIGFAFGVLIEPARIAGAYIGQEIGLTIAATTDPGSQRSTDVVTLIVESWAILLFFLTNTHHILLAVLRISLEEFPIGRGFFVLPVQGVAYEADLVSKWGLLIASPIGLCMIVTIVFLGLLMRAVPQINVFAVGLSIRLVVGMASMLLFLPVIVRMLVRVLGHAPDMLRALFG